MIPGAFPIIAGAAGYTAKAVTFDGSSFLQRAGAPSGPEDSKLGTISAWFRFNGNDGKREYIACVLYFDAVTRGLFLYRDTSGELHCGAATTDGASTFEFETTATVTASDGWTHFMASWDMAGQVHAYLNGVSDITSLTQPNKVLAYANTFRVGTSPNVFSGQKSDFTGDLAEFYFDNTYIDLSVAANRAKFRRGTRPAFLGDDGSKPTGAQPAIYLSGDAESFITNKGYGGDFTVNGTLTDASTSPSD